MMAMQISKDAGFPPTRRANERQALHENEHTRMPAHSVTEPCIDTLFDAARMGQHGAAATAAKRQRMHSSASNETDQLDDSDSCMMLDEPAALVTMASGSAVGISVMHPTGGADWSFGEAVGPAFGVHQGDWSSRLARLEQLEQLACGGGGSSDGSMPTSTKK